MRHFYHLTHDDRIKIEALLKEKHTPKEIANNIGCHISTIYRELKRGRYEHRNSDWTTEERYSPDIADEKYRENLAAKGPGLKIGNDIELAEYIENKIVNEKYSPGAVLGEIKHKGITFSVTISKTTLYSYIDKGIFLHLTNKDLPVKKNEKKKYDKKTICKAASFICFVCCVILCVITYIAHKANSDMIDETSMITVAVVLLSVLIIAIITVGLYVTKRNKKNERQ